MQSKALFVCLAILMMMMMMKTLRLNMWVRVMRTIIYTEYFMLKDNTYEYKVLHTGGHGNCTSTYSSFVSRYRRTAMTRPCVRAGFLPHNP